jgi:UDP-N-acetylmuramate dehydrogenase
MWGEPLMFSERLRHLIREHEPLAPFCWLRLGGAARYFAEPNTLQDFCDLIAAANEVNLSIRLLGDGSDIVVRDEGYDGLVIRLAAAELCKLEIDGTNLVARAGARLNHIISAAAGAGLAGVEHLAGIPGTIGAAVMLNAGVTNDDLGSRVRSVKVINRHGQIELRPREELRFGFRRSNLEDSYIAEVELGLEKIEPADLTRRMQANWIVRRAAQPMPGLRVVQALIEPNGTNLADVMEKAGVRDAREGEATFSSQHPGYLIVSGNATSQDVLALLARVLRSVEAKTGIQLQSPLKIW